MTALIVISIIIATLVLHFTIGNIAAGLMSKKVAELSMKPNMGSGQTQYEWENNFSSSPSKYETRWLNSNWEPASTGDVKWAKTGRHRDPKPDGIEFSQASFKARMTAIRWIWFIAVPSTIAASIDNQMIEKYDPSVAERKALQQASRIKELEKELEIDA